MNFPGGSMETEQKMDVYVKSWAISDPDTQWSLYLFRDNLVLV